MRIADGDPQRVLDKGQRHMPGEQAWPVGEWRSSGKRKFTRQFPDRMDDLDLRIEWFPLQAVEKPRYLKRVAIFQIRSARFRFLILRMSLPRDRLPLSRDMLSIRTPLT